MIVVKQWSPRCSKRIKEIYDNLPNKGNAFLEQRLNALYEQIRHTRKEDRSNLLQELFSLRLQVKPEITEDEAEYQVNFKPTKENAGKIQYLRKEGFTDSQLFEVIVLMDTSLKISPIEPSVEESKETPQIETREEEDIRDLIKDLLANRCDTKFVHCVSEPFSDNKDGRLYINCPKAILKRSRYGWEHSGKVHGKIPIEQCMSMQRYELKKKEKERAKKEANQEVAKEEKEDLETPQILVKPELSIEEIVDQLGVCENPIIMREKTLLCHLCEKRDPHKWQACQENQKEIETNPIAGRRFFDAMIAKTMEAKKAKENPYWFWEEFPKTEDMTLEEIEKELGLRSNPPSPEDLRFDAYEKRYQEKCVNCEEHLYHRCSRYCREFLNGLELPQEETS